MAGRVGYILASICVLACANVFASQEYWYNEKTGKTQWEEPKLSYNDADGNTYYHDPETGESTWVKPATAAWSAVRSEEHDRDYYYNEVTKESVWEKPEPLAWRRVAAGHTEVSLLPAVSCAAYNLPRTVASTSTCYKADPLESIAGEKHTSKQGWGQTKVYDVLEDKHEDQGNWLWCSKDDYVIDAVRKMTKGNVGSLLVFDPSKIRYGTDEATKLKKVEGDAVVGIVTERDYLTKVVVVGKNSSSLHVKEIMTPQSKLRTVSPQSSVLEVMTLMMDYNFRHVPVVHEGNYLGMISIRDVVNTMVQEHREEVGRLHEYIQGSY
ncbi:hypothetical protein WJX72_008229 [[Myrmecia] bisecta]|uniref:Uncharacterized protein n=1 Tax=[Myrmecia] bisecta TaxID=41462 RepID=A0AAW1PAM8_9CHLO